jgi:WD40 repeat protein
MTRKPPRINDASDSYVAAMQAMKAQGHAMVGPVANLISDFARGETTLERWKDAKELYKWTMSTCMTTQLVVSPSCKILAAICQDGMIRLFDTRTHKLLSETQVGVASLPGDATSIGTVLFTDDEKYLIATPDADVVVYAIGESPMRLVGERRVTSGDWQHHARMYLQTSDQLVMSSDEEGKTGTYLLILPHLRQEMYYPISFFICAASTADRETTFTYYFGRKCSLRNFKEGINFFFDFDARYAVFSPDGSKLVVHLVIDTIVIIDVKTGEFGTIVDYCKSDMGCFSGNNLYVYISQSVMSTTLRIKDIATDKTYLLMSFDTVEDSPVVIATAYNMLDKLYMADLYGIHEISWAGHKEKRDVPRLPPSQALQREYKSLAGFHMYEI